MEVIDNRTKNKEIEWRVGDVICYWNDGDSRNYSMICETNHGYTYVVLSSIRENSHLGAVGSNWDTISNLITDMFGSFDYIKKVNAKLIVEDFL